jgi:hypothetical protein
MGGLGGWRGDVYITVILVLRNIAIPSGYLNLYSGDDGDNKRAVFPRRHV